MTYPTYNPGPYEGAPPVYPVQEVQPGTEVAYPGEPGAAVHLVDEHGPGVQSVYFEGGLPPHLDRGYQAWRRDQEVQASLSAQAGRRLHGVSGQDAAALLLIL